MTQETGTWLGDLGSVHERWAHLRFVIVGPLLASPPRRGELGARLLELAEKEWRHPGTGEPVSFGMSTIERWYYAARHEARDPVGVLRRKVRSDKGKQSKISAKLAKAVKAQHEAHPAWSYTLHVDNLVVVAKEGEFRVPSYATVRRYMLSAGLVRQPRRGGDDERTSGAEKRHAAAEVRSYEVEYVLGLWHLDFHECSRGLVTEEGEWKKPWLFAVLDDHSRLCCHAQWYWEESSQTLCHGLMQGIMKRGLPRRAMMDRGGAMKAEETRRGLRVLSILQELTLEYSPHQNAKAENFWERVEGRLVAMLEGVPELTLDALNEATQAWVELEYNRGLHGELGCSPLERFLSGRSVGRPSPEPDALVKAFRVQRPRTQRKSDGTISIRGQRYEVPSRFRTMRKIQVCYARWDLRRVHMIDAGTDAELCQLFPLDRRRNADGRRGKLAVPLPAAPEPPKVGVAPLLKKLMAEYAATGLPPAYMPLHAAGGMDDDDDDHT